MKERVGIVNPLSYIDGMIKVMTNETKQTSVDQLFDQLSSENLLGLFTYDQMTRAMEILEQAKAMHKEEIITTWHKGYDNLSPMIDENNCGDKYYNETYGGNNEP
tara:strand:+ start:195 stop:509 length:315 start_codon:yes stop_codon:yes gene_type:complete